MSHYGGKTALELASEWGHNDILDYLKLQCGECALCVCVPVRMWVGGCGCASMCMWVCVCMCVGMGMCACVPGSTNECLMSLPLQRENN